MGKVQVARPVLRVEVAVALRQQGTSAGCVGSADFSG